MKSWIRIRIKVKSYIRIRIKVMRIRNTDYRSKVQLSTSYQRTWLRQNCSSRGQAQLTPRIVLHTEFCRHVFNNNHIDSHPAQHFGGFSVPLPAALFLRSVFTHFASVCLLTCNKKTRQIQRKHANNIYINTDLNRVVLTSDLSPTPSRGLNLQSSEVPLLNSCSADILQKI